MYCQREGSARRWPILLLIIAAVTMPALGGDFVPGGPCTRGRVRNNGTTIVTDWGTLLRGACWGPDQCRCIFDKGDLKVLKQCGLNSIHVYGEYPYGNLSDPVGYNVAILDSIVEWCREESLYVVMCMGGQWRDLTLDRLRQCWEFYAPRYADQTHVVYELNNEPDDNVAVAKTCWPVVRPNAPETHVLLLSPSNIQGGVNSLFNPIAQIGDAVDWSNASIAYHGYGTSGDFQQQAVKTMNDAGYGMTCTEFWPGQNLEPAYESGGISYFHLIWCSIINGRGIEATCERVRPLNISFVPDFGDWPQHHIDYPTLTKWEPWTTRVERGAANAYRLFVGGIPQGNVRTVYDLSGRALWGRQASDAGAAGVRCVPRANSRVLVVGYGDE